jgi:hypothetical protein
MKKARWFGVPISVLALFAFPAITPQAPLVAQAVQGADAGSPAEGATAAPDAGALSLFQDLPVTARVKGQLQLRFLGASIEDADETGTFLIPRARLGLRGAAFEDFDYQLQVELGGAGAPSLLDAEVRYTFAPIATLRLGRAKAPFGREQLVSSTNLNFVDRSIVDQRFAARRQQGVGLEGRSGRETFAYNVGVYNGRGSQSAPGNPFMTVGRVVWTPFGAYPPMQGAHDYPDTPRLAVGVSAMSAPESGPAESDIGRMGVEVAYGIGGVNMMGELFREWLDPQPDAATVVTTDGFLYQVGYLFENRMHEVAGRFAMVGQRGADQETREYGVAHSYYMQQHRLKLQTDIRRIDQEQAFVADRWELRTQLQLAF